MSLIKITTFALFVLAFLGCGRAMPPRPPEDFAPGAVTALQATAAGSVITMSWRAPAKNQMGDELTEIAGYKILRRPFVEKDNQADFSEIGAVSDSHLVLLAEKRAEARAAGISGRRVKLPESSVNFSYSDAKPLVAGEYQVVAFQKNGQVGLVDRKVINRSNTVVVQELK